MEQQTATVGGSPVEVGDAGTASNPPRNVLFDLAESKSVALGTIRILIVEDDLMQQKTLVSLFAEANEVHNGAVKYVTTIVRNAGMALATLATQNDFNIILLDAILPDVNGYDLLPRLREVAGPLVAVLMLSAHVEVRARPRLGRPMHPMSTRTPLPPRPPALIFAKRN